MGPYKSINSAEARFSTADRAMYKSDSSAKSTVNIREPNAMWIVSLNDEALKNILDFTTSRMQNGVSGALESGSVLGN